MLKHCTYRSETAVRGLNTTLLAQSFIPRSAQYCEYKMTTPSTEPFCSSSCITACETILNTFPDVFVVFSVFHRIGFFPFSA